LYAEKKEFVEYYSAADQHQKQTGDHFCAILLLNITITVTSIAIFYFL
jgi:hypothetical protein